MASGGDQTPQPRMHSMRAETAQPARSRAECHWPTAPRPSVISPSHPPAQHHRRAKKLVRRAV